MARSPNADFHLVPMDGMSVDAYTIKKAANNLRRLHREGKLPPIPEWGGDTVEGYLDILGLNGRAIKVNHGPGMRKK